MRYALLFLAWFFTLTASGATGDTSPAGYILDSGDLVRIQVYGESDLTLETRLSDSGTISYPFLGQIRVAGMTLERLRETITEGLSGDYLLNPRVNVTILEYRQFFINGEVRNPGGFPYQPGLTVRKAISIAGGFTERASRDEIFIIPDSRAGKQKQVDLNAPVQPGDIITIEQSFF